MRTPKTWTTTRLEKIVLDTQPGFAQRPNRENLGIHQLRTNNISTEGGLDLSEIKYVNADDMTIKKYGVEKGDIIFNNTNSPELVGKTALFDLDTVYVISNHMTRIRVDPELVDSEYLARYLHYLWQIGASKLWAKQWVNQAAIDQPSLKKFDVLIPTLPEQYRIAALIRRAVALSQWRREINKRSWKFLSTLFSSMFGNPLDDRNSWGFKPIREMGIVTTGNTPPRNHPEFYGNFLEWIKTDNILDDHIHIESSKEMLSEIGASVGRTVPSNSILVACIAGSIDSIGRAALTNRTVAFNQQINAITPFEGVNAYYLYTAIRLSRPRIQSQSRKAVKEIVSKTRLEDVLLISAPKEKQDLFAERFIEFYRLQELTEASHARLDELLRSITVRAFTGELTKSWREKHEHELSLAAWRRDNTLRERTATPKLAESTIERLSLEETELLRQSLGNFAVNIRQMQESLVQPVKQMTQFTQEIVKLLEQMNRNLVEPVLQSIQQSIQTIAPITLSAIENELILRSIDALPIPQATRAIIKSLDITTSRVLKLAAIYPAYFTAADLETGELGGITTLQAEASLRVLQALGFVKFVQVDRFLRYRLIEESDHIQQSLTPQP